jgi:pimeloyl-ACP methyl ester carboxylesterase
LTLYFISGLGADERIFERLVLPRHFSIIHIHWIEPFQNESLADYSRRLWQQVEKREPFVLIGLSFGGIVAIEIAKLHPPLQVVLISSISNIKELPITFRAMNAVKLYRLVPSAVMKIYNPVAVWWFGARSKREKELLASFLKQVSPSYLKWSIHQILNWQQEERLPKVFHIHGTSDRIFFSRNTNADVVIPGGQHMMVHDKGKEVSEVMCLKLEELSKADGY